LKTAAVSWTLVPWENLAASKPDHVLQTINDLVFLVTGNR